jgi:hypothetical protein
LAGCGFAQGNIPFFRNNVEERAASTHRAGSHAMIVAIFDRKLKIGIDLAV